MIEIPVSLGPRSYPILVGAGALSMVGTQLAKRGVGRRVVLVSDPTIARLHGDPVLHSLTAAGFDLLQRYRFGRPVPPDRLGVAVPA